MKVGIVDRRSLLVQSGCEVGAVLICSLEQGKSGRSSAKALAIFGAGVKTKNTE